MEGREHREMGELLKGGSIAASARKGRGPIGKFEKRDHKKFTM